MSPNQHATSEQSNNASTSIEDEALHVDIRKKNEHSNTSWSSRESISLLMLLPAVHELMLSATYSYLPNHFLDMNWSLTVLGLILMIGNGARLLVSTLVSKYGDWVAILFLIALMLSYIVVFIQPTSDIVPTCITMTLLYAGNIMLSLHGLVQQRYGKNETVHKTSLRIFTVTETLGYSFGSLIGGLLYEYGGWNVCCIFSFATVVLQVLILISVPAFRKDFTRNCCTKSKKTVAVQGDEDEEDDDGFGTMQGIAISPEQILSSVKWYVLMVLGFQLMNQLTYGNEWALFAVFFRQEYNWSSGWTGAGQMTGDLLAAFVLFLSVAFGTSRNKKSNKKSIENDEDGATTAAATTSTTSSINCLSQLLSSPWHILIIGICIGILNIIMVLPNFTCSVVAQIFMGTTYVFGVQTVNEMLRKFSMGSKKLYRKFIYYARLVRDSATSISGLVSLLIYEHIGPRVPFILVGALMFLFCLVYGIFITVHFGLCVTEMDIDTIINAKLLKSSGVNVVQKSDIECGGGKVEVCANDDEVHVDPETVEVVT